jgi:hypothetical protein
MGQTEKGAGASRRGNAAAAFHAAFAHRSNLKARTSADAGAGG